MYLSHTPIFLSTYTLCHSDRGVPPCSTSMRALSEVSEYQTLMMSCAFAGLQLLEPTGADVTGKRALQRAGSVNQQVQRVSAIHADLTSIGVETQHAESSFDNEAYGLRMISTFSIFWRFRLTNRTLSSRDHHRKSCEPNRRRREHARGGLHHQDPGHRHTRDRGTSTNHAETYPSCDTRLRDSLEAVGSTSGLAP